MKDQGSVGQEMAADIQENLPFLKGLDNCSPVASKTAHTMAV